MSIIDNIIDRAKSNKKRIVLPETEDKRIIDASIKISKEGIADVILIGNEQKIKKENDGKDFTGVTFIDPHSFEYTDSIINCYYELRKDKGISTDEARETILNDKMYFACMLVKQGYADGAVSGACHSTGDTLRPALQIIKSKNSDEKVSAFFLMEVPNCKYGSNGIFIFADCGLIQNPTSDEIASIAASSASSFASLVGKDAKVALISHSTKGSASHLMVDKMVEGLRIAKEKYPDLVIDGELQVDAALDSEVANMKSPNSPVAGQANVLVFSNIDAGNSGYKLVQRLANANAYGPITQGLNKPINDLSRGCSVDDIVGVVAITAVQCE